MMTFVDICYLHSTERVRYWIFNGLRQHLSETCSDEYFNVICC